MGAGSGAVSKRTVAMSTPDTPSTSAWCVFVTMAKRSPFRRWTSQISHSGLARSSSCEKSRPESRFSSVSVPGRGSAVWRTW